MRHGTYIGTVSELKNMTALLKGSQEGISSGTVYAQFDLFNLEYRGVRLSHGWHEFAASDFELEADMEFELEAEDGR